MYEIHPEELLTLAEKLPSGTMLFLHKPFVWNELSSYDCAFMRKVIRSKKYHHGCFFVIMEGIPFIIEASMFSYSRPKKLENWVAKRKGYIIGVKEQEVPLKNILQELDKWYDHPAALSLVKLWITGKWTGHTGNHATNKGFCLELLARALGMPNAHMALMRDFGIE